MPFPATPAHHRPITLLTVRVIVVGTLIVVLMLVVILGDEHQPHVDLAPPPVSLEMPAAPVASGAIVPENPTWQP